MSKANRHIIVSSLDDLLREEGLLEGAGGCHQRGRYLPGTEGNGGRQHQQSGDGTPDED